MNNNNINHKKKINLYLINYLILIYFEILYKIFIFGFSNIFTINTLIMIIFLLPISICFTSLFKLFKRQKLNFILMLILVILTTILFSTSFVFKKIYDTFFCISVLSLSDQALAFTDTAILEISKRVLQLIFFIIPIILLIIFRKKLDFEKISKKEFSYLILVIVVIPVIILMLFLSRNNYNSYYYLFYKVNNNALNIENVGIITSTYLDLKRSIFGFKESLIIDNNDNISSTTEESNDDSTIEVIYKYNKIDIDFDKLSNEETNNTIKQMHEYFKNETPTLQNEYTNYFKDKNLIVIMGESFSSIAVDSKLTPTLYKLVNSSFVFNNFYTPVNLSTIGGEFQDLTGLFADLSDLNKYWRKGTNSFPFGLGTVFKNLGYNTYAYHANYGTFQSRNVYLGKMGFDNFLYRGNGLEKLMNCNLWPQSDYDMVNATYDKWINDDKFMVYYVSVSGHMPYSLSNNNMTKRNWDKVKNLDLSNDAKGYLAANIELDKALESLINKLDESGKLDDTVIALVADHYPYAMELDTINELSTYKRDGIIEVNHNNLIIWNNKMETVNVDKVASQLDFIPTIYNLFGIEYDSRLFMGKDILSTEPGLAFFANRSWVTDKGRYYASSNNFVPKDGESVTDDYVSNINKIVANRINMSKAIIENNYYEKVIK